MFLFLPVIEGQNIEKIEKTSFSTHNPNRHKYAPVPFANGVVYTEEKATGFTDRGEQYQLMYVENEGEGKWGEAVVLSMNLSSKYTDGPGSVSNDEETICFGRSVRVRTGNGRNSEIEVMGLYFAYYVNGEWTNVEPFEHNNDNYIYFSPHLTDYGKTLYFAANLEDSRGGYDLYVSRKQENGRWSTPENLGDNINTVDDEVYPFWHVKGKRLYFSSKGHVGSGDADLYYASGSDGEFGVVKKLPDPLNSRYDDIAIYLSDNFNKGYITRRRGTQKAAIYSYQREFPSFMVEEETVEPESFCYRLRDDAYKVVDEEVFDCFWTVNDTLKIPGHEVICCFPGPGTYYTKFNVRNKLTDTLMLDVAPMEPLVLEYSEAMRITAQDTVRQNQRVHFTALDSYMPYFSVDEYYWSFDYGGDVAVGPEVDYVYVEPGEYRVELRVIERLDKKADWEPMKRGVYRKVVVLPEE